MSQVWYYYDTAGQKCGPVSSSQLKALASQGVITPATRIANEQGKEAIAEKVKGLFSPPPNAPTAPAAPKAAQIDAWYYYDTAGQKCGPVSSSQLKSLAKQRVITPTTRIANSKGKEAIAEKVQGLFSPLPKPASPQSSKNPKVSKVPQAKPASAPVFPPPSPGISEQNPSGLSVLSSPFDAFLPADPFGNNPFDAFPELQSSGETVATQNSSIPSPPSAPTKRRRSSGSDGIGYFAVLKRCTTFSGRARRKEFWMFYLINIFVCAVLVVGGGFILITVLSMNSADGDEAAKAAVVKIASRAGAIAPIIAICVHWWLMLAAKVRRLHDIGRSGWWVVIGVIPFVAAIGGLILLIFFVRDSQRGSNKYGPSPKRG